MPRQPRFYFPGAVLHIVQRGNDRAPVFTCARDHRFYLDCLRDASRTHDVSIHAYVLMTNHVHMLASPGYAQAVPRMMQSIGRRYVGRFNFLHRRTGTLWEGRYKATLVETEAYLFACQRYIELNPVRALMVLEPADFRWSSHRANAWGGNDPVVTPHPSFLGLAPRAAERREVYRRSFGLPLPEETVKAIRDATQFEWALGGAIFRARVEACTGRRTVRLPMGRRRTDGESKSRL
jgi:putative transposase